MNRKGYIIVLVLVFAFMMTMVACGGNNNPPPADTGTSSGEETTPAPAPAPTPVEDAKIIKLTFPQPAESIDGQAYSRLSERVAELTDGSVIIEVYPSSSLMDPTEVIDALLSGELEMAHNTVSFFSGTVNELTPLELPGAYRGDRYLELPALLPVVNEIYEPYGLMQYSIAGACNFITFTTTKSLVKTPADFQGMNIRVAGKWFGEAVKLWGANPVTLATGEITTAFERGTIDGVYAGDLSVIMPFKLYELANYITLTTFQEQWGGATITLKCWNSLTPEQQDAMMIARDEMLMFYEESRLAGMENFIKAAEAEGVEIYELTDAENKAFKDLSLTLVPQTIEAGGPGSQPLADALEKFRAFQASRPYEPFVMVTSMD